MALDEFIDSLIKDKKSFASVTTLMPDGSPQASLMWVDSDDEYILLNLAEGRVKTDNLRKDNRVAIAIFDSENPYKKAMGRDRVVDETHQGPLIIQMSLQKNIWDLMNTHIIRRGTRGLFLK
jgi:hypothetical protein